MSVSDQRKLPPPPPPPRCCRGLPPPPPRPSPGSMRRTYYADEDLIKTFPPPPRDNAHRVGLSEAILRAESALKENESSYQQKFDAKDDELLEMAQRLATFNDSLISVADSFNIMESNSESGSLEHLTHGDRQQQRMDPPQAQRQEYGLFGADEWAETDAAFARFRPSGNDANDGLQKSSYTKAQSAGSTGQTFSRPKRESQNYHRSSSTDGPGSGAKFYIPRHRSDPPPPPPGRKKSWVPPPPPDPKPKKPDNTYASMLNTAERMSSDLSLDEPSLLQCPNDEEYWKKLRGLPKCKTQMKGRGRQIASHKKNAEHEKPILNTLEEKIKHSDNSSQDLHVCLDAYDSCGEASCAELSRHSRNSNASKNRRAVASQLRRIKHEKRKAQRQKRNRKTKDFNTSIQSLDRKHYIRGNSQRRKNHKNKSGIVGFIHGIKERNHNLSIQSMLETMSIGSIHSGRSKKSARSASSRKSARSSISRKTTDSKHSKKSSGRSKKPHHDLSIQSMLETMSLGSIFSSKRSVRSSCSKKSTRSMNSRKRKPKKTSRSNHFSTRSSAGSGVPVLSVSADMFIRQSVSFDEEISCSSSLSSTGVEDNRRSFESDSEDGSVLIPLASVADAVEHLNSQNKITKFVSKVKQYL
eukprot:scaffold6730_cov66-Cyclotella_meneghiniana.AAC.9